MRTLSIILIITIAFAIVVYFFRDVDDNVPTIMEGVEIIEQVNSFMEGLQNNNNE